MIFKLTLKKLIECSIFVNIYMYIIGETMKANSKYQNQYSNAYPNFYIVLLSLLSAKLLRNYRNHTNMLLIASALFLLNTVFSLQQIPIWTNTCVTRGAVVITTVHPGWVIASGLTRAILPQSVDWTCSYINGV